MTEHAPKPVIAAFDFDGTITTRDTFVPYLDRAFGWWPVRRALLSLTGEAVRLLLKRRTRDDFKAKLIKRLFTGQALARLREVGHGHASAIESLLRPAAIERIVWHRQQGHRLVMVSASLDLYLEPIAERLGFDDLLCTRLSHDRSLCDGGMEGENCRAAEKIQRLERLLGALDDYVIYAYGDSAGDKELLEAADFPHFRPFL